tara:strand:+ start:716 stop:817 length:102 start_codon:yes stop_codon:yes gene_type:complete
VELEIINYWVGSLSLAQIKENIIEERIVKKYVE